MKIKSHLIFVLILILVCTLSLVIDHFGFLNIKEMSEQTSFIIINLRLPRIVLALLIGSVLAVVGWIFQIHFKNELATPYTLGVSSLAALALALTELFTVSDMSIYPKLIYFLIISPLVLILLKIRKNISRDKILLFGVALGILSSSAIVFIQSLLGNESVGKLVRWMMGSLNIVGWNEVYILLPFAIIFWIYIIKDREAITILSVGDLFAKTRGINSDLIFRNHIVFATIIVSVIVWLCGPIGLVGLIVPQIVKRTQGFSFKDNIILCGLWGAIFLVLCDLIARNLIANVQAPVGAVTSVIGAPFMIYFIVKGRTN